MMGLPDGLVHTQERGKRTFSTTHQGEPLSNQHWRGRGGGGEGGRGGREGGRGGREDNECKGEGGGALKADPKCLPRRRRICGAINLVVKGMEEEAPGEL